MIHKELSPPSRRRTVWLFLPKVLRHAARPMPAVGPIKMPATTKLILCMVEVIPQTDLFLQFGCSPKPAGLFLWNWRQTNESQGKWRNLCVTSQTLIHAMRQNIPLSIPQSPVVFCGKIKTSGRRWLQSCHWLHASLRTNFQFWKHDGFLKGGINISGFYSYLDKMTQRLLQNQILSRYWRESNCFTNWLHIKNKKKLWKT